MAQKKKKKATGTLFVAAAMLRLRHLSLNILFHFVNL